MQYATGGGQGQCETGGMQGQSATHADFTLGSGLNSSDMSAVPLLSIQCVFMNHLYIKHMKKSKDYNNKSRKRRVFLWPLTGSNIHASSRFCTEVLTKIRLRLRFKN